MWRDGEPAGRPPADVPGVLGHGPPLLGPNRSFARAGLDARLLGFNALSNFRLTARASIGPDSVRRPPASTIEIEIGARRDPAGAPLVSCLMLTKNREEIARLSIRCFRQQSWPGKELVVVDSGESTGLRDWVARLGDPSIRFVHLPGATQSVGELRNVSVAHAQGTYVAIWDDDDLSHPARLEAQLATIAVTRSEANLLHRELFWQPQRAALGVRMYRAHEHSLVCLKSAMPRFPDIRVAEDTPVVDELLASRRVSLLDLPELYLYVAHGTNASNARQLDRYWKRATAILEGAEYATALAQLARCYPIEAYRRILGGPVR